MKAHKIGTLFIVSVLALAGIGISYAGWIDTITVTGTVQTGTVEFHVTEYSGTWVWKHFDDGSGNQLHDKEVHYGEPIDDDGDGIKDDDPGGYYSSPEWELVASSYAHNSAPTADKEVKFEFENLYPCINFEADFWFTIGTIPVHLNTDPVDGLDWITGSDWIQSLISSGDVTVQILDESGNVMWPAPAGGDGIVQLHPGVEYHWILTIHIPQEEQYMGKSASAEMTMDIIQWSDNCGGDQTPEKKVLLPDSMVVTFAHYGDDSYWDTTIDDLPGDGPFLYNDPLDEEGVTVNSWCVEQYEDIYDGQYTVDVHYDDRETFHPGNTGNAPTGATPWDCVDYILNHKNGCDKWNIQEAIWYFVNGGDMPDDDAGYDAYELVQDTLSNVIAWINDGYPTSNGILLVAVLLDAGVNEQFIIIEVDP